MSGSPGVDACPVSGRLVRLTAEATGDRRRRRESPGRRLVPAVLLALDRRPPVRPRRGALRQRRRGRELHRTRLRPVRLAAQEPVRGSARAAKRSNRRAPRAARCAPRTCCTPSPADPTGLDGTVIRIDPDTGAGLPGNPLLGSLDANERRIVAYGFRNPFRFAIDPERDEVYVDNVGNGTDEEIDRFAADPGHALQLRLALLRRRPDRNPDFDNLDLDLCESLYAEAGRRPRRRSSPTATATGVAPGDPCPASGRLGDLRLGLLPRRRLPGRVRRRPLLRRPGARLHLRDARRRRRAGPTRRRAQPFLTDGGPYTGVDIEVGPDGDLYYLSLFGDEALHRISLRPGPADRQTERRQGMGRAAADRSTSTPAARATRTARRSATPGTSTATAASRSTAISRPAAARRRRAPTTPPSTGRSRSG